MPYAAPASLDTAALFRRLAELAGHERQTQVEFLLHLDVFDQRRAWAEAGYPSLWEWCVRALHLSEGAAGRRIAAMRVLRRLPGLAEPLRDGRLSLSTAAALGPVLTEANWEELVQRAAFKTKAETEQIVASLQPRQAPREGLRRLPRADQAPAALSGPLEAGCLELDPGGGRAPALQPAATVVEAHRPEVPAAQACRSQLHMAQPAPVRRATLEPVSADTYSLRVTVDAELKKDLDQLKSLLAHKVRNGDLGALLREAVRCALEKHGKRRGAIEPARQRKSSEAAENAPPPAQREPIPAAVRREVWKRDGGRCAWCSPGGRRCGSTWMLELDHIQPVALGGRSTADNLRLCCRTHNALHAEQVFGREHMDQFRKNADRTAPLTAAGGSTSGACGDSAQTAGSARTQRQRGTGS